jgi:hypothetical protein
VDEHNRPGSESPLQEPGRPEYDLLDSRRVIDADTYRIDLPTHVRRRCRHSDASAFERLERDPPSRIHGQFVTLGLNPLRHRQTHAAKSDEADVHRDPNALPRTLGVRNARSFIVASRFALRPS